MRISDWSSDVCSSDLLMQHRDAAGRGDATFRGRKLAGQEAQQGRFADAVAPDEADPFALEVEIETRKDGVAVRRGPAEVGDGNRWRRDGHGHELSWRQGGSALRSDYCPWRKTPVRLKG